MFLCLFLEIPLFYCLQTMENTRKSMGTNRFSKFFANTRKVSSFYVYWPNLVLLAWLQPILWMIQYFSKYIGNILDLPISRCPPSLKHQYFWTDAFSHWNITEKRQIGYSKKWESFMDLANRVFELFKIKL